MCGFNMGNAGNLSPNPSPFWRGELDGKEKAGMSPAFVRD